MNNQALKQQGFVHLARHRVEDLRKAGLISIPGDEITSDLADTLSSRLTAVCEEYGWQIFNIVTKPNRIEVLLAGMEPSGEIGESVSQVLDRVIYREQRFGLSAH